MQPARQRLVWCAVGLVVGLVLWLAPGAVVPAGAAQTDLARLLGQCGVFAVAVWLLLMVAGRRIEARGRHIADALNLMAEPRFVGCLLGGALALRLGLALLFPDHLTSDAYWYHARAVDLTEGRGYVRPGPVVDGLRTFIPTAFWPVGYSAFLAGIYSVFGASWRTGIAVNALLSSLSVWVLYRIGVALYGRRVARFAAVLACLCPVLWPRMLLAESLFTLLLLCALWVVLTRRVTAVTTVGAGLLMAAAVYVKVNALPFTALLALVWWVRTGGFVRALGHTVLCCLTITAGCAPWTLRNLHQLNALVPTTTSGGVALLMGAFDGADGREPLAYSGPIWTRVLQTRLEEFDEVGSDGLAHQAGRAWITQHPLRWAGLSLAKLSWMSLAQPWQPPFELLGRGGRALPAVEVVFKVACRIAGWLVLIGLCGYVARCARLGKRLWREGSRLGWVPLAAWLGFALQAVVFVGYGRLRLPVEGLLILAGAYAWLAASQRKRWPGTRAIQG